ncbi:MAG: tRNA lysidine(34) synthetase TilS [Acidimicrobiia bacterium]|nr:tRNA lysidine(34) synthetase TilS [Acidimicrobiia bacterium]
MDRDPRKAATDLLDGRPGVVALSGGADSAAAAWACGAGAVRAIHVHHGLPASDAMLSAATAVADALSLPLTVVRVDLANPSETAARAARWGALRDALDEDEVVVTGHTKDDQAETVLLNLVRGAGPEGLGGMRQRTDVVRPLLGCSRAEVRALAEAHGLPFADDPENASDRHARTKVRSAVLPLLTELNPGVVDALARAAAHHRAVEVAPTRISLGDGVARIPLPLLATIPTARAVATIREAVRQLRPPYPPSAAEVDRVLDVARGGRRAELEGGIVVLRDRRSLRLGPLPAATAPSELGSALGWGGFRFAARTGHPFAASPARAILDPDRTWEVRGAEPTDRITMGAGHKVVWDALAEAGVPAELRPAWPVVHAAGEIAWVPLVRRAPDSRPLDDRYLLVDVVEDTW